MKLTKILGCSLSGLKRKRGRSILTIIAVTVTIMLVVFNISLLKGFGEYYTSEIKSIGSNWLFIRPGFYEESPQGGWRRVAPEVYPLTRQDSGNVSDVAHVAHASSVIESTVFLPDFNKSFALTSITKEYFPIFRLSLEEEGRLWGDYYAYEEGTPVPAVVGKEVGKILKPNKSFEGYVNFTKEKNFTKCNFEVLGILKHKVTPFFLPSFDKAIFIPIDAGMNIIGSGNKLHRIVVEVDHYENMDVASNEIKNVLKRNHGGLEDFWVISLADTVDFLERQMGQWNVFSLVMNLFSVLIACIVILVVMIMAVTERKREIGVMRAVGAKRNHILFIFLSEASSIILISYFGGCILGVSLLHIIKARLGGVFAFVSLHEIIVPSMITAFYVCVPLCILFALYPAWKATKVSPIEAIRYE